MDKTICALGLMSGTSMDGVDASLISSDGEKNINIIGNIYLKYDSELKNSLKKFSLKINSLDDLKKHKVEFDSLERKITIKHSEVSSNICKQFNCKPDIIGFHGQTILHKPSEKYSIQMGDAQLLSQLLRNDIVYQFRKKDIDNEGEGAPLTPIYHHNLKKKLKIRNQVIFLNIGGISNFTFTDSNDFFAQDIGPGNCLMDEYLNKIKNLDFDKDGKLAASGEIDISLINNLLDHEHYNSINKHSFDIKDFDINFVKGLTIENALANLNFFTAKLITTNLKKHIKGNFLIILCGGGRKNKTLILNIKKNLKNKIINIDEYGIDGDFVESQAFAYLSIRSILKKKITFPETTKVKEAITGGELIKFN